MSSSVKRHEWLLIIVCLVATWFADQFSKQLALQHITFLSYYGPFGLVMHRNPGAILGVFADLPPVLRVVSLSTGGAFLVFIYAAIQYLLPGRILALRMGMSLLLGGILGNVTDRIRDGSVVDFFIVRMGNFTSPAFNFADAIQWVGYFLVVYTLLKEGHNFWPNSNERKRIWVLPKFQLKYTFVLLFVGIAFTIIAGVFSYTYLSITIEELQGPQPELQKKFLVPFLDILAVISVSYAILLFIIGRILSHRLAGPLYAFELFLEDLLNGKDRPLKLRSGDEFMHLELLAERIRKNLKDKYTSNDKEPPTAVNGK